MQLHTECNAGDETSGPIVLYLEGFDGGSDKVRHVQSYDSGVHVLLQTDVRVQAHTILPPGVRVAAAAEAAGGCRDNSIQR